MDYKEKIKILNGHNAYLEGKGSSSIIVHVSKLETARVKKKNSQIPNFICHNTVSDEGTVRILKAVVINLLKPSGFFT